MWNFCKIILIKKNYDYITKKYLRLYMRTLVDKISVIYVILYIYPRVLKSSKLIIKCIKALNKSYNVYNLYIGTNNKLHILIMPAQVS